MRSEKTADTIINALHGNPRTGMCRCPAHDDRTPSLRVGTGRDGKVLVKCHAGCSQERVINALKARGLWSKGREPKVQQQNEWEPQDEKQKHERLRLASAILRAATHRPTQY